MIYFKNVPQYGDLEIEKVLFLFDNIPMETLINSCISL